MRRFLCALPNDKRAPGRRPSLATEDPALAEAFIKRNDRPGWGVFECVSYLDPGATERNLQTARYLPRIVVDQDLRAIEEAADKVDYTNAHLPLLPTEIRNSGGGRHLEWQFKEPIERDTEEHERAIVAMKKLVGLLGGDPIPTHAAALLRVPGTCNSKYDKPVVVEKIGGSGQCVDLVDIEEMVELLEARGPLLTVKPPVRLNGSGRAHTPLGYTKAVDLSETYWNGPGGNNNIHEMELRGVASEIGKGKTLVEAVDTVLAVVHKAVCHDPINWDAAEDEAVVVEGMGFDFISKYPEHSSALPDEFRDQFEQAVALGKCPRFFYRKPEQRWHIRVFDTPHKKAEERGEEASRHTDGGRKSTVIEAKPFVRFDPAKLPPREWVYGRHYQRGVPSATVGAGGGGKSSIDMIELMAMCTGRPLLGEQPLMRCRVWYHNAEDNMNEIKRRIAAACQHYDVDQGELEGWMFVTSGLEMPIKIAASKNGSVAVDGTASAAIIRTITDNEIAVASFDPLIAHHTTLENSTGDMDQVAREFARIANVTDCAIEIVHHTRKPAPARKSLASWTVAGLSRLSMPCVLRASLTP